MKRFLAFFLSLLLLSGLCGCDFFDTNPPSPEEIQTIFQENRDDFLLVTEYLVGTGYTDISVNDDCTSAFANFKDIAIEDEAVVSALKKLSKNGCSSMSKRGNTVHFCLWTRFNDAGCGIAYSVDGKEISIEYMTQALPLSEEGWFYYVDDFNEWRANNS